MKIRYLITDTVSFEELGIGDVFESSDVIYLKIDETFAFNFYYNTIVDCSGWIELIPRKAELIIS